MEIRPTILTDNVNKALDQKQILDEMGLVGHLDVIDGEYSNFKTVSCKDMGKLQNWEVHLMVNEPVKYIEECIDVGVKTIIGQIEKMGSQSDFVDQVARKQVEVGLGLDLETELDQIDSEVWLWLDKVVVMGVKAGRSGQKFEEKVFEKLERLVKLRKQSGYSFVIEVDGGVTIEVAQKLKDLGVEQVAVNSAFWTGGIKDNWDKLKDLSS